jgi:aconitate hydratase
LLGVKAVIVESFERIHRSNLVGMGVLPLQFRDGVSRQTLGLTGEETIDIIGAAAGLRPRMELTMHIHGKDGSVREESVICRIDTLDEVEYFRHGGILQYVLRSLVKQAA